jgi:hypothetical protein
LANGKTAIDFAAGRFVRVGVCETIDTAPVSTLSARRAKARSRADRNRSAGRLARQCMMTRSSSGGACTRLSESGTGSALSTAAMTSAAVERANGIRPVTHSYSTHPVAKMSLSAVAAWPWICSGAM